MRNGDRDLEQKVKNNKMNGGKSVRKTKRVKSSGGLKII
jgi:hypothetical protein